MSGLTGLQQEGDRAPSTATISLKVWRRSFDIPPPDMVAGGECRPVERSRAIAASIIPATESLKTTLDRVLPY